MGDPPRRTAIGGCRCRHATGAARELSRWTSWSWTPELDGVEAGAEAPDELGVVVVDGVDVDVDVDDPSDGELDELDESPAEVSPFAPPSRHGCRSCRSRRP